MTAHASDLAPLLAAILEAPDSLAARLAYADALADDPRGELIRVQCEAESAAAGDPRWGPLSVRSQALLAKHEKTWTAPFAHSVPWFQWRRGMIEKASAVSSRFASDPGALLAREPVTSLSLRELTRDAASKIGERPELARLRTLRIAESRLGPHIGDIVTSRLERLVELELYQAGLDDEGLERVGEAVFERLVRLEIAGQSLSQPAVTRLLGDARLAALGSLSIGWLAPGNEGAARVARHLALPSLRHLELPSQRYAHDALRVLVENPCVRRLTGLRLDQNALDAAAVEALGALRSLEDLDLSTNPIGVAGARALAITELPLRRLRLMQTHIGHAGVRALAAASFSPPDPGPRVLRPRRSGRFRARPDQLAPHRAGPLGEQDRGRRDGGSVARRFHAHHANPDARLLRADGRGSRGARSRHVARARAHRVPR